MITRNKRKILDIEKNEINKNKVIVLKKDDEMDVSSPISSPETDIIPSTEQSSDISEAAENSSDISEAAENSSDMDISEESSMDISEDDSESNYSDDYNQLLDDLKRNDKQAYDMYVQVIEEIDKREPNIIEILKTPMRIKDKSKLVEMYEIYKTMDHPSEDSLILKDKMRVLFKRFKENYQEIQNLSPEKVDQLKSESKRMKSLQPKMNLKQQILTLNTTPENKITIYKKFKEYEELEGEEASKLKKWLGNAISIPHSRIKTTNFDQCKISEILNKVYKTLSEELYGMEKVKEQLILFLNAKLQNSQMRGCSLGLIGLPGTGKTSVAKTLSKCLDLPFSQISFGGVSDPEFLTGHDYTYIGSRPGEIVRSLQRMEYKNGIIFLDEFEKVSSKKGITSSLLHITDFSQNNEFRDNYLADITIDLSNIWFIYSMNNYPEDSALRDRIFYIEVDGYTIKDKIQIIKNYLLPKALLNIGKLKEDILMNEETILHFINKIDRNNQQKGVRTIEKAVKDLVNKVHFLISNKDMLGNLETSFKITFNDDKIRAYPLILDCKSIDKLVKEEKKEEDYLRMFL